MSELGVTRAVWAANGIDGKWSTRTVSPRVEWTVDGTPVTALLAEAGQHGLEGEVTVFETAGDAARDIVLGHRPFEEWLPDASRLPVLMCSCGDLVCGTVTVALTVQSESVTWTDWARENYYSAAAPIDLPAFRFDRANYRSTVEEAARMAASHPERLTFMRVRRPGPWWLNVGRIPQLRTDRRAQMGWLHAEAVEPSLTAADGSYFEFLADLESAQALLAGAGGGLGKLGAASRHEFAELLTNLLTSEHVVSLPVETVRAAQWFRHGLLAEMRPSG